MTTEDLKLVYLRKSNKRLQNDGSHKLSFLTRLLRSSLHGLGYETKKLDRRFSIAGFNFEPNSCSVGLTPQGETTGRAAARMISDRNLNDLRVLDICCGEGIVGLTIFAECRNRIKELHFADINIFNLNSVRRTLRINNLDSVVRQGDIQTWLSDGLQVIPESPYDIIVSNPPHSGGRLRLGVGNGWNPVEFVALGEDFSNRGKRIEEQVELLRALWTQDLVTYDGKWHEIRDAGINPLPIQRPIPVWFGGSLIEPVLRRIARLADGWIPGFNSDREPELIARMHGYLRDAGRQPGDLKIERLIELRKGTPDDWVSQAAALPRHGGDPYFSCADGGGLYDAEPAHQGDRELPRRCGGILRPGLVSPGAMVVG